MDAVTDSFYRLTSGNARFMSGDLLHPARDEAQRLLTLNYGQAPYAAVLSCADSRVPIEVIFDAGIGELFSVRNAGNVCDDTTLGSLELCVQEFKTPVIVCMGHTHCGAVGVAMSDEEHDGYIPYLVDKIKPVVASVKEQNPDMDEEELLNEAVKANAINSIKELYEQSELIREKVKTKQLRLEAAVYHLNSGKVDFFDFEPE